MVCEGLLCASNMYRYDSHSFLLHGLRVLTQFVSKYIWVLYDTANADLIELFHSLWFRRQEKTTMKLVVDAETDEVLGASMCGPDAPEIMQVHLTH